jgi:predicted porin
LSWAFLDVGNEYDSAKVAWVSPKWAGFQFGLSFAPSSVALSTNDGFTAISGGSARQSTSIIPSDVQRPRNMYEIAARWQGNFGAFSMDVMAGYLGSAIVNSGLPAALPAGTTGVRGLSVGDFGASVTFAGFSVFGNVTGGNFNGQAGTPQTRLAPVTVGGVTSTRNKNEIAYTVGAMYTTGPYTMGTSWYAVERQGSNTPVGLGPATIGNRREYGWDIGGIYNVVPGLDFFLQYTWGQIHQNGVNFRDGAVGLAVNSNSINSNVALATILVRW